MSARTIGLSPKLPVAIVMAVLTYVLGQEILELPAIAVVAGQATLVGLGVYAASPGRVEPDNPFQKDPDHHAVDDDHGGGE